MNELCNFFGTATLQTRNILDQCQTINKQNKLPCKASGILMKNGNIRCRMHGGWSNGQTTIEGKIKAYKNLPQFKNRNDEEIRTYIANKR